MRKQINLKSITRSHSKKWKAKFTILSKGKKSTKTTHFGAKGYKDYTMHKDKARRDRYISRHRKDLKTKDPTRAGYLSMFILWNRKTRLSSIADYRRRLRIYNRTGKFPIKI